MSSDLDMLDNVRNDASRWSGTVQSIQSRFITVSFSCISVALYEKKKKQLTSNTPTHKHTYTHSLHNSDCQILKAIKIAGSSNV